MINEYKFVCRAQVVKNLPARQEAWVCLTPGLGRSPGEGNGLPTPVFLPGEFYGWRSLTGSGPCGCKELDMTEHLTLLIIPQ